MEETLKAEDLRSCRLEQVMKRDGLPAIPFRFYDLEYTTPRFRS